MDWPSTVKNLSLRLIFRIFTCLLFSVLKHTHGAYTVPNTAVNEFIRHERVLPLLYREGQVQVDTTLHPSQNEHFKDITVIISTLRKNFTLDLKLNGALLASSYVKRRSHSNGYHVHKPSPNQRKSHCFYHGHIRGDIHSMAALSTCEGISGFWSDHKEFYHIEPSEDSQVHLMYRDSEKKINNHTCGYHSKHDLSASEQTRSIMKRVKRDIYGPYDSNKDSRYVELYLVNDFKLSKARGVDKLEYRSKAITNIVSRLYKPLNIYVALVGVEIWDQTDLINITPDPNATLDNFLRFRRERINPDHPNDNAQLLTGVQFTGGVVGKAVKGPICTFQYSGGVNMDYSSLVSSVATTVAHELGHNFGMQHDGDSCVCPQGRCIMAPVSGSASPTMWSSCSKQAIQDSFHHGMDYCLRNKPTELFGGPMCGNGFVEDREECDCGLPEACESRCCNATTCKLLPSALCATGECCDQTECRHKAESTECRPSKGECDFAEYCNGRSEFCPADVFVEKGHKCDEENAFCFEGKCRSHTSQCQLLWGSTGEMSNGLCYRQLNTEGRNIGNCGFDWVTEKYSRCRSEDVLCGMLLCIHKNEKLMFWKDVYARSLPASFIEMSSGDKMYVCRGAVLDVGLDIPDPGLVPNGAKCGSGKMCIDQKCRRIQDVQSETGAFGCSDKCNGNGVCNSKGNCHCDPGYAPPLCDKSGFGGSEDSGPSRLSGDKTGLLVGMLILFLLIIPLIILLLVAFFKRDALQKWWKTQNFKYSVPKGIGKPPPRPTVKATPSVESSNSVRENKFRNVSFRTGNPPAISNPVLTSSTNRNSRVIADDVQAMETFKPTDESDYPPIYGNVPPPRPPPPRPKSIHEDATTEVEFHGGSYRPKGTSERPPPPPQKVPLKPPTNRQRDKMLQQNLEDDNNFKFENSKLALKPPVRTESNTARSPDTSGDTLVSALKARFDSGEDTGTRGRSRTSPGGRGVSRSQSGSSAERENVGRSDSANRGETQGRGRGVGRSGSSGRGRAVGRSTSGAARPPPPPPSKPKPSNTTSRR